MDTSKFAGRTFKNRDELGAALMTLYNEDKVEYIRQCGNNKQFRIDENSQMIILNECIQEAGNLDGHYFLQDIWAANNIYRSNVKHVYDIGSRVDGYISHLLSMEVQVTMLDIRPLTHSIEGLNFIQTNAMDMNNIPDNSIETLSSLHAFEHFGLGRYGDPVDYNGWKKALHEIKRKLKVGGTFYFSVPVGRVEKLIFNAHRIFNPMSIINELTPELTLHEFSFVENFKVHTCLKGSNNIAAVKSAVKNELGDFSAGLFIFNKTSAIIPPPRNV